jgi:hypothetical protein
VAAQVTDRAYRGESWLLVASTAGGQALRVLLPGGTVPPEPGAAVTLAWEAADLVVLAD